MYILYGIRIKNNTQKETHYFMKQIEILVTGFEDVITSVYATIAKYIFLAYGVYLMSIAEQYGILLMVTAYVLVDHAQDYIDHMLIERIIDEMDEDEDEIKRS